MVLEGEGSEFRDVKDFKVITDLDFILGIIRLIIPAYIFSLF